MTIDNFYNLPLHLQIFVSELFSHATQARAAIIKADQRPETRVAQHIFDCLDDALDHAARVSQILFPNGEDRRPRGREIRGLLGIPDEHALDQNSRRLRNRLQHIDANIDSWLSKNKSGHYIDKNISPISELIDSDHILILRHLDPKTGIYIFMNEQYDTRSIVLGCVDVILKITEAFPEMVLDGR